MFVRLPPRESRVSPRRCIIVNTLFAAKLLLRDTDDHVECGANLIERSATSNCVSKALYLAFDALVQQIAVREKELKAITNRLLSASSGSIEGQLHELRQFVEKGISDLRSQLNRDTALAKAELQKHLSEVRMTPAKDGEDWHYVAEGNWDLLGTGPNAPVLGLAHSDGCGGQI